MRQPKSKKLLVRQRLRSAIEETCHPRQDESDAARRAAGTCRTTPRLPGGAFSVGQQDRPAPLSPPSPSPCPTPAQREQERRSHAGWSRRSAAGQSATVEMPIVSRAATSVALRPTRSPKCPNTAEPIGRAKKAIANVASDCRIAAVVASPFGKKSCRKHEHRSVGVDIEIEELDRGADQAGEQHAAGRRRAGGRRHRIAHRRDCARS